MKNFDSILEKIGPFGRFQAFNYTIVVIAIILPGIQTLLNVYLQATPEHWCYVPELANLSVAIQRNITSPYGKQNGHDSSCHIRDINYSVAYHNYLNNYEYPLNVTTKSCQQWDYDYSLYGTTAVTKWNLVCERGTIPAIAQSIYMLGFLIGNILFGYISDRLGRKPTFFGCIVGTIVFGSVSAFIPELWTHMFVRMLTSICAAGCLTVGFVLGAESIGVHKRLVPSICLEMFFTLGYMLLAGVAYVTRDFFWTNFILSASPIVILTYSWLLVESPRWLLTQGRISETKRVLTRAAKINGAVVDIDQLVEEYTSLDSEKEPDEGRRYTIIDLLRTPNMRKKCLLLSYDWFVSSMVFYGLTMSVTDFAGDPYLNLFISGVAEMLAILLMALLLDKFGRRICITVAMIVGGVACMICGLLPSEYSLVFMVLSVIGKFFIAGGFAAVYPFTAELMPTVVRTIGVGTGSMSARVGGLLAPLIGELKHVWTPLPTVIFGVFALTSGVLSLLLPETLNQKLPETLEEGERFGRHVNMCRCIPRKREFSRERNSLGLDAT